MRLNYKIKSSRLHKTNIRFLMFNFCYINRIGIKRTNRFNKLKVNVITEIQKCNVANKVTDF